MLTILDHLADAIVVVCFFTFVIYVITGGGDD